MSTAATPRRQAPSFPLQPVQPAISCTPDTEKLRQSLAQRSFGSPSVQSLLWGLPPQCERRTAERLIAELTKASLSAARRRQIASIVESWLDHTEIDAAAAWEGAALLHALPQLSPLLSDSELQNLWDRWQELSSVASKDTWDDDPARFALLAIETPLLLAAVAESTGTWRKSAIAAWDELATRWLDEQGLPEARYLSAMRPVLASWTRCALTQPGLLAGERRVAYVGLLREAIRLTDAAGREAFSQQSDPTIMGCFSTATELAKDSEAGGLLSRLHSEAPARRKGAGGNLSSSVYSEARQIAILRSRLTPDSPRLTVCFDRPDLQLELCSDRPLLSGTWSAELSADGQKLHPQGNWEEVLRHEDEDVEYLELELSLGAGWALERHILLARQEGFALLADAVIGEREATIAYASSLPLFPGVQMQPERETHESWLSAGPRAHLVLPLALPEWRSDRPLGELSTDGRRLILTTAPRRGRNLFHPLLIPLASPRRNLKYTWRHLTVGENLEIQPLDAAAAYRIQLGDRQWVVYRALTRGNRTFLGKNLTSDLFVGVFHRNGEMDAIMEVE